jgi:hypothetical protein
MSEIQETRLANLNAIIGKEEVAVFARNNGLSDSQAEYIRQCRRGVKTVGGGSARTIEAALGLEPGTLEQSNVDADLLKNSFARKVAKEAGARDIPQHMQQTVLYLLRTAPEKTEAKQ